MTNIKYDVIFEGRKLFKYDNTSKNNRPFPFPKMKIKWR